MKGSYKSRWVIVIVVVIAAIAAFWFLQGRNDSQSAAPGATKQAQQSPAGGRRGMRAGPLAPVQAATAVEQAVPRYLGRRNKRSNRQRVVAVVCVPAH